MGYNTAILVLNDTLNDISDNPQAWWDKVRDSIATFGISKNNDLYISSIVEGTKVFHMEHADCVTPYALGGNYTFVIGNGETNTEKLFEINLLKNLAKKYDYRLVKRKEN